MIAYVAHVCRTEQSVAYGMYEHVGVAVTEQSELVVELYSTEPEVAAGHKFMHVETESYTYFHIPKCFFAVLYIFVRLQTVYLLNRSFMPSMSKLRVKRSVWSSGLLLAVAIT